MIAACSLTSSVSGRLKSRFRVSASQSGLARCANWIGWTWYGAEVRVAGEHVPKVGRRRVVLIQRRQAEDQIDGLEDAGQARVRLADVLLLHPRADRPGRSSGGRRRDRRRSACRPRRRRSRCPSSTGCWRASSTVRPSAASLSCTNRLNDQSGPFGLMSRAPPPWSFG